MFSNFNRYNIWSFEHLTLFLRILLYIIGLTNGSQEIHYHSGGLQLNPNLHRYRSVCLLSLLNTVPGNKNERWIPECFEMKGWSWKQSPFSRIYIKKVQSVLTWSPRNTMRMHSEEATKGKIPLIIPCSFFLYFGYGIINCILK